VVKTNGNRACPVCGTLLADDSESCPVCALQGALTPEGDVSGVASNVELRFEHYQVLKNEDGTPVELGHGAMGIAYKAFDIHLQCPVALKIINAELIGDTSARHRFVREARAAASVRHPNVASVFHLGESGGNYFYVMEFVEGETLEKLIRRSNTLETDVALEVVAQVAAGLTAIQKQHLVHRDIKPSNIMVSLDEGRLESVKIIDLGLAKVVAEADTISTSGSFTGTPGFASPEQFAGLGADIRSDLYSLGIALWEMLSGKLPFQGPSAELMYQHQHVALPIEKLRGVPAQVIALLQVLLAKDPNQRFQTPAQLRKTLPKVREAIDSGVRLTADELRAAVEQPIKNLPTRKPRRWAIRWVVGAGLCLAAILVAWFFISGHGKNFFNQRVADLVPIQKSIAVLPFENISANKDETYFADGVQDEILANVARISALKVISRTSVMQYRPDAMRDLRQIAHALGVANILEGTVRRAGNRVRITIELVDAGSDHTIWSEIYDRDLTDIFAIQSEVAETIARKLTATLSPDEKKRIEAKATENPAAYDRYLQAGELLANVRLLNSATGSRQPLLNAIDLLEQAVQLDPRFALAYCAMTEAQDRFYSYCERTAQRRALGDEAINAALRLRPDLPEAHLEYGVHLFVTHRDYDSARRQLAIARHGLPNNSRVIASQAFVDARQGDFEKAIHGIEEAINIDPLDASLAEELGFTSFCARRFRTMESAYDHALALSKDNYILKVRRAWTAIEIKGDVTDWLAVINSLPLSALEDVEILSDRIYLAVSRRDWQEAARLLAQLKGDVDASIWARSSPVPRVRYAILIARLQGEPIDTLLRFMGMREEVGRKVAAMPLNAELLSDLAVVDALLARKQEAIAEAKQAAEIKPISNDAVEGPPPLVNLAVVYAWCDEPDLAFAQLESLAKTPRGIYAGSLMLDPLWDPLRSDPRFDKLLAELAQKD
jgi:serine/threonine protein kinase/tetratricopeptide (TPR) repeat protein